MNFFFFFFDIFAIHLSRRNEKRCQMSLRLFPYFEALYSNSVGVRQIRLYIPTWGRGVSKMAPKIPTSFMDSLCLYRLIQKITTTQIRSDTHFQSPSKSCIHGIDLHQESHYTCIWLYQKSSRGNDQVRQFIWFSGGLWSFLKGYQISWVLSI